MTDPPVSGGEPLITTQLCSRESKSLSCRGTKGPLLWKDQLEHVEGEGGPLVKCRSRTVEVLAIKRAAVELWESRLLWEMF